MQLLHVPYGPYHFDGFSDTVRKCVYREVTLYVLQASSAKMHMILAIWETYNWLAIADVKRNQEANYSIINMDYSLLSLLLNSFTVQEESKHGSV